MPIVKLFNGEEIIGEILDDRTTELVIGYGTDALPTKKIIQKQEIYSIDF